MSDDTSRTVVPRPSERLLAERRDELLSGLAGGRILCGTLGRAQLAAQLAQAAPQANVVCHFLDLYQRQQAERTWSGLPNLELACTADPPEQEFDRVAFPLAAQGDGELTRELLQSAHLRLRPGGTLWAATDNPRDRWLRSELDALFGRVSCWTHPDGALYRGVKRAPLRKVRDFSAEYRFRDRDRLLTIWSRPGVFSHRHLDTGARALLEVMEVEPGQRVIDLGCGVGAIGLAAAARAERVQVLALDANPRAIQCTTRNAAINQLDVRTQLDADVSSPESTAWDLVLANPPYYSRHRIARLFVSGAARALRPGGRLLLVTKDPQWYVENLGSSFSEITVTASRAYAVVAARRNG